MPLLRTTNAEVLPWGYVIEGNLIFIAFSLFYGVF